MTDPTKKEDSLDRARREIERRMLHAEKLKRIEEAEIARLRAEGWRRPGQIVIGRGGPTLHDAARAIETMEEEKDALAKEAKRRITQRARERTADQSHVHRHATDKAALEKDLDRIQAKFVNLEKYLRDHGAVLSADMFRRYLDGTGGKVIIDADKFRAYPGVREAANGMIGHYIDWMTQMPTGLAGEPERIFDDLRNLQQGQSIGRQSHWDRLVKYPILPMAWGPLTDNLVADNDLYAFAGEAMLRGDGAFQFTRNGDQIDYKGNVAHHFDEPFDFERGRDFLIPLEGALRIYDSIKGEEGELLQQHGRAKPFDMHSQWIENISGKLDLDANDYPISLSPPVRNVIDPRWARVLGPIHRGPRYPNQTFQP